MQVNSSASAFSSIIPLMQGKSNLTDPEVFHDQVNVTFHNMEAASYDIAHQDMWDSLLVQNKLLVDDAIPFCNNGLRLLDIGCGTGLSTSLLMSTRLKNYLSSITMMDTSVDMLKRAKIRAGGWNVPASFIEGHIHQIHGKFDFIVISSVLHHIPDLKSFLQHVIQRLAPGGILLTIHDPLHEAITSEEYKTRCITYANYQQRYSNQLYKRIYNGIKRRLTPSPDYIHKANQLLLANHIIHTPLTEVEMWSITDIHVEGLPYSSSEGISIEWLKQNTEGIKMINYRTYGFFGFVESALPYSFKRIERSLYQTNNKTGRNFGSIWIKD